MRNCPRPSAWGPYGRAFRESCKSGHFWEFQASHSFVLRGRRGTLWHFYMFHNVSKVVLCGRHNTFASFSEDELHFSWQAQHFGGHHRHFAWQPQHFRRVALRGRRVSIVILRGTRNTLDVSCCVFLRIVLSGLQQLVTTCKLRCRHGILQDVMKIDGSLARNIDFEVHEKIPRKI